MSGNRLASGSAWLAVGLAGVFLSPYAQSADAAPGAGGGQPAQAPAGGGRGGRGTGGQPGGGWGGGGGMFGAGQESETAVPGVFHIIENTVDGWRRNPIDAQRPDQIANFRGNPPTVAITSLIEVDDATANKITKLAEGADSRAKDLVIKYGAKVDKLYRARLNSAKGLLKDEDKEFFDAVVKAWDAQDEACRKITETDAAKRTELLKEARVKAMPEILKGMKPEYQARMLTVLANHSAARIPNSLSPDGDLCVFWGQMRLEWDELFKAAEGDAEKLKTFTTDYEKARDLEHEAFKKELQALYDKVRDEIIAALPNEQDRKDLQAIADWAKKNSGKISDITKQMTDMWNQARTQMGGAGGAQPDFQAMRQQGDDLRKQIGDLRDELGTIWPDRFKDKVPQGQGRGGQGFGGGAPGAGGDNGGNRGNRGNRGGGATPGGGGAAPGGEGGGGGAPAGGGEF